MTQTLAGGQPADYRELAKREPSHEHAIHNDHSGAAQAAAPGVRLRFGGDARSRGPGRPSRSVI